MTLNCSVNCFALASNECFVIRSTISTFSFLNVSFSLYRKKGCRGRNFKPVERQKFLRAWQDSGDPRTTMVRLGFIDSMSFRMDSPSDLPSKSMYCIVALTAKVFAVLTHLVGNSGVS